MKGSKLVQVVRPRPKARVSEPDPLIVETLKVRLCLARKWLRQRGIFEVKGLKWDA